MEAKKTETVKIDFEKLQAAYFLRYGYRFDETTLAVLFILITELQKGFVKQNVQLNTATEKIKTSQRTLEADKQHPRWQAFAYGMGRAGLALLMAVIFAITFYIVHLNNQREQAAMPAKLKWYEDFYRANILDKETKSVKAYLKNNPMPE